MGHRGVRGQFLGDVIGEDKLKRVLEIISAIFRSRQGLLVRRHANILIDLLTPDYYIILAFPL